MIVAWLQRRAARRAIERCWNVPYTEELSQHEIRGMRRLEARGEVERDVGWSGRVHWHRAHNLQ